MSGFYINNTYGTVCNVFKVFGGVAGGLAGGIIGMGAGVYVANPNDPIFTQTEHRLPEPDDLLNGLDCKLAQPESTLNKVPSLSEFVAGCTGAAMGAYIGYKIGESVTFIGCEAVLELAGTVLNKLSD